MSMPGRHSLQWRMTLVFSTVFALLLAIFLGTTYRQVRKTLVAGGAERAGAAARELSGTLGRSLVSVRDQVRRMAQEPALTAAVRSPEPGVLAAARAILAPGSTQGARRAELWNTQGRLILGAGNGRTAGNTAGIQAYPENAAAPRAAGLSEIQPADGGSYYFAVTEEIKDTGGQTIGFLRRFGQFTPSAGSPIQRLLGDEALLKVGTEGKTVWTDFAKQVPAPPEAIDASGRFKGAADDEWVGATSTIAGTRWTVWVGYPLERVAGSARRFFLGALPIAALILVVGFETVRRLTRRLARPLPIIAAAAEAVASGDYTRAIDIGGDDEFGRLGQSFNTMTATLARDAAARRTAEEALGKREADFRALFAANPLPMWVYDVETLAFLEVNAAAIRLYGYTRDEFLRMRITEIRPPEDVPALMQNIAERRDALTPITKWRHRIRTGSEIDVEITSHTLTFEGRPAALVVARDVTLQTLLEQQLRQAQKMEAVGQLAGGVAHDFNNLLTAILGSCELLQERLDPQDPGAEDLAEIRKAGRSAADLTRQLLAFSRKQVLLPQALDPNAVIHDVQTMLRRVIGAHIQLEARLSPEVGAINVDRSQLEQILMNLAVNARDAMPGGGQLTIETTRLEFDSDYAKTHPDVSPGSYVMLAVSDSGIGMDARTRARMFEPFFTTKGRGEGTGLGLATIYGIVKQSGGSIEVYSEPGRGTTFKVYFPRLAAAAAAAPVPTATPAVLEGHETILVVEDQIAVRRIACRILARHGYAVLEAGTGEEGLRAILEAPVGAIQLLLTDLVLPDMTGADIVARADLDSRGIRVLYTSGYADESIVRSGIIQPGSPFLQKPYAAQSLLQRVRETLDRPEG